MTEGILTQLLEKKDLHIYVRVRTAELKRDIFNVKKFPKEQRENMIKMHEARISELKHLLVQADARCGLRDYSTRRWEMMKTIESASKRRKTNGN